MGGAGIAMRGRCAALAKRAGEPSTACDLLADLDARIVVHEDRMLITLAQTALASIVGCRYDSAATRNDIELVASVSLRRRGHEMRLVYAAVDARLAERDPRLIQLLASGRAAYTELCRGAGRDDTIRRSHLTRLARLHFLAPDIVMAILDGRQPVELTARSLMRVAQLPLGWNDQRRVLGLGS